MVSPVAPDSEDEARQPPTKRIRGALDPPFGTLTAPDRTALARQLATSSSKSPIVAVSRWSASMIASEWFSFPTFFRS
jgi:hypothetical protein